MIQILLADDQRLFREGLIALLSLEEDIEIVGEANHGREAIARSALAKPIALAEHLQPDVILMDVRMPICNGVEATREIHNAYPWIQILVLTTFDEDEYVFQSLEAGALGYLLKSTPFKQVAIAIRNIQSGYSQLGPTIAPKVFAHIKPSASANQNYRDLFNQRELAILRLLGLGKSNQEIALDLHLAEGTVKNHLTNIFGQLGVRDHAVPGFA